ncbi:MAG: DUF488 domain-containing protein [Anaerolineae bacterium]|nr:DUF488 domain-containing protein [Anaerolineae bacterium]
MTTLYTVGHSNHPPEAFCALLREHGIELVVDVRSSPYSRYVPQANREALAETLEQAGIAYRWMGDRLGGKPQGQVADYDELRASPSFQEGIAQLLALADLHRTAVMCAEGDHRRCHRHKLITPALLAQGAAVVHIQSDGSVVDEEEGPQQLLLF